MFKNFDYRNVGFKKDPEGDGLVIYGDIINKSGRNYHAVVFRIIVFIKSTPIGSIATTINGFAHNQTKKFEKKVAELEYSKVISAISHYEIYPESAY